MRTRKWLWRWQHNPLKRRSDRVEAWVALVAGVLVMGSVPFTGALATGAVSDGLRDRSETHRSSAVLLENAPSAEGFTTETNDATVRTKARWKLPDGSQNEGVAPVPAGTPKGTRVPIWVDDKGLPQQPPPGPAEVAGESFAAGAAAASGTCFAAAGCYWLVRRRLDTLRVKDWEREWTDVEPRWSKRD